MADPQELIIVGVDPAWKRSRALDWAVHEAVVRGRPLRAIHVVDEEVRNDDVYDAVDIDGFKVIPLKIDEAADRLIEEVGQHLAKIDTTLDLKADLRAGKPVEVLVELSGTALMLVLGRHGHGVFRRLLIGSTSDAVANKAKGPVVVVPDGWQAAEHGGEPVLVGVDWTEPSEDAVLDFALDFAAVHGVPLQLVVVWDAPWAFAFHNPASEEQLERWRGLAEQRARELTEQWGSKRPDVEVRYELRRGHPVERLVEAAEESKAQLLAVGGRRRSRASELIGLGSVADGVLHHAARPLAVVNERR
jgi:nucleotide-binding universal stress UspA family protein